MTWATRFRRRETVDQSLWLVPVFERELRRLIEARLVVS